MRLTLAEALAATGGVAVGAAAAETEFARVSTDTREDLSGALFVALKGERFDGHAFLDAAAAHGARGVLVSGEASVPAGLAGIRVDDTLEALGLLARHVRRKLGLKVAAVTGSFGKTTTKDMAVALLKAAGKRVLSTPGNLNNRIGLPLTLLAARGDEEIAVLELGISEPGEMALLSAICEPDAALVTGVGAAHTQGLGDVAGVAAEKLLIASRLAAGGVLLLPHGEPLLKAPAGVVVKTFGEQRGADRRGGIALSPDGAGSTLTVEGRTLTVPLPGRHNAQNALAAWALVRELGVEIPEGLDPLAGLKPARLRGEVRRTAGGVNVLVDCYNANPGALAAALETLSRLAGDARKLLVLGEMRELGALTEAAHRQAGVAAAKLGAARLILLGQATEFAARAALAAGMPADAVLRCATREEATNALREFAKPGDWVLIKGSRAARLDEVADALAPAAHDRDDACCTA